MPQTPAQQLLDAQVNYHLEQLTPQALAGTIETLANQFFDAAGNHQVADLIDADALKLVITRGLTTLPDSPGVVGIIDMATEVVRRGPGERVTAGELVERQQVEALVDAVLSLTPALEKALGRLTESPLVGTAASRFMGRIAGEVLATNQAIADKIPGLGSLTRLGTSAASKVVGVADKQLEGLMNATVGKGSSFAIGRLNRILVDTIKDPATREAVLQVWDLAATEPLGGLDRHLSEEQITSVTQAIHELAVTALAHDAVADLAAALVDAFLEWFGGYTPTELLEQLQVERTDVMADLQRLAPRVLSALRESGDLERIVRARLEPFYSSPEVAAILGSKHQ